MAKNSSVPKSAPKPKVEKSFMKRRAVSLGLVDETQFLQKLRLQVNEILKNSGFEEDSLLDVSLDPKFGEFYSSLALRLAGKLKKAPQSIAQEIVETLKKDTELNSVFSEITVAPNGFINFRLTPSYILIEVAKALEAGEGFGCSKVGDERTILVESPSINPNAQAHVGHLMNLFLGRALARIFEKVGFNSEADNLINNRGIKICMAMWGVKNLAKGATPESTDLKSDHFVGKYYVDAKALYHSDEKVKAEIDQMLKDWEAGKPEVMKLWEQVIDWAFTGHKQTLARLGEEIGHMWLESDIYLGGKDIIMKHLGKGVVEQLPDGAIIGRLKDKYGIPDVVLIRSNGTSLYHTQDIYLAVLKVQKFKPWKVIWVVGNEHIVHFQKLFALLEELDILSAKDLYHMAYGVVMNKEHERIGKQHELATADGLMDFMHKKALEVMGSRKVDIPLADRDAVAEKVGLGALRFIFLDRDPYKDWVFDPDAALSFTGKSGPYVMYAYTRGKSVLEKLGINAVDYKALADMAVKSSSESVTELDKQLFLKLLLYPTVILEAANNYAPNELAEYLYQVASLFNNFYEKETISGAEGDVQFVRAALTDLTTRVLQNGLGVLGIEAVEKM